ncbi:MAG: 50S ribosomal protein L29 [Acidimicrobiales bacterium]
MSYGATELLELRDLDREELWSRLDEVRREVLNLRFQQATGQLDDHAKLGQARRRVARVLTVIRESELTEDGYLVRREVSNEPRSLVRAPAARTPDRTSATPAAVDGSELIDAESDEADKTGGTTARDTSHEEDAGSAGNAASMGGEDEEGK